MQIQYNNGMKRWIGFFLLFGFFFLLVGCQASPTEPAATLPVVESELKETPTPFQPETPTPTLHPTITPPATETPTVTPTAAGCQETQGTVVDREIQANGFNAPLEFKLYLPPCYETDAPQEGYPLLTLLHGQTFTPQQWIEIGLVEKMDELISDGEIAPFVVVMPYESAAYAGGLQTAILKDLIPHLQDQYLVCRGQDCNAIGGISRGGGWALSAVFKNPDAFTSLGLHSVPTSPGHLEIVRYGAASAGPENLPRIWVDYGLSDYWYASEKDLIETFDSTGVDYEFTLNEGGHDNVYWETHLVEYLRWYAAGW